MALFAWHGSIPVASAEAQPGGASSEAAGGTSWARGMLESALSWCLGSLGRASWSSPNAALSIALAWSGRGAAGRNILVAASVIPFNKAIKSCSSFEDSST